MFSSWEKKLTIGLFFFVSLLAMGALLFILRPSYGDGKQLLKVRFPNVNKIYPGTIVTFAGKAVGKVVSIEDIEKEEVNGLLYFYEVVLEIDSKVAVYDTYEFSLSTAGLLGEQSIAILPRAPLNKKLTPSDVAYAQHVDQFSETFKHVINVSGQMERTFGQLSHLIHSNEDEISSTIRSMRDFFGHLNHFMNDISEQHVLEHIDESILAVKAMLKQLEEGGLSQNLIEMSQNGRQITEKIHQIVEPIQQQQGTIGKLLFDSDLYFKSFSLLLKAGQLVDTINQYGLLFHNAKEWKRTQAHKFRQLHNIENQQQFAHYLESEIHLVLQTLQRLTIAASKKERYASPSDESQATAKALHSVLKKIDDLKQTMQLYLQELEPESP